MKKIIRCLTLLLLMAAIMASAIVPAAANFTGNTNEKVNTKARCTLTLTYAANGTALEGETIQLYRVASISADGVYKLYGKFANYPLSISAPTTQREWREMAVTLESYVVAGQMKATAKSTTGSNGVVSFSNLAPGLYLVSALSTQRGNVTYIFDAFVVAVPGLDDNGHWFYDVSANPKSEEQKPDQSKISYNVVKTWRDTGSKNKRPDSVTVVIYKNGVEQEKRVLNADNNWMYTWTADNDGSVWTVAEPNVPDGYTVSQQKNGRTFIIINSRSSTPTPAPDPKPTPTPTSKPTTPTTPKTGDMMNLPLYWGLLAVSSVTLVILCAVKRRKRHEA